MGSTESTDPARGSPDGGSGGGHAPVRLQKVLARAGAGSRRTCEDLIAAGRVEVGDRPAHLGMRVDPATDVIRVDGQRVPTAPDLAYLALNKPRGVHSTMADQRGRPSLARYVADRPERLFHVGRLDAETEGLILLTNDGELAHRLTHPAHGVGKTYVAEVPGPLPRAAVQELRRGVHLDDGPVRVDTFRVLERTGDRVLVELALHEGRNRVVRRMFDTLGHPVRRLVRTQVGPVTLGGQRPGTARELGYDELVDLYTAAGL